MREFVLGAAALLLTAGSASAQVVGVQTINEEQAKACQFVDTAFSQGRRAEVFPVSTNGTDFRL